MDNNMKKLLSYILTVFILAFTLWSVDSMGGTGAIPNGDRIKLLKDKLKFKNINVQFIANDTDDPMVVAKDADQGSIYIQTPTGRHYRKMDSGLSVNWQLVIVGATGTGAGTDNHLVRWDGTGSDTIEDSLAILNDAGELTGLTRLDVDNIRLDGNTISSLDANGSIIIDPTGTGSVTILGDLVVGGTMSSLTPIAALIENEIVVVNYGGNQATGDANRAGVHAFYSDSQTRTAAFDTSLNSGLKIGIFGQEEEVLTANHAQSFTSKTGSFVAGLVGLPSIYFDIDTNSGFWQGADDDLRVSTGGAERLAIRNTEIVSSVPMSVAGLYDTTLSPDQFVRTDSDGGLISTPTINLVLDIDGILPIINGGTNNDTALSNEKIMVSKGGKIGEWSPQGAGESLSIDSGGSLISQSTTGTINQVNVLVTDGDTNFSLPQDIHLGATPSFSGLTISGLFNQIGLMSHTGNYDLTGDFIQSGDQFHTGNVIREGSTDLIGGLSMTGDYDHIGFWSHSGFFDQNGSVLINGAVAVVGDISHIGDTTQTGDVITFGAIDIIGTWSIAGNMNIAGDVTHAGTYNLAGQINATTLSGNHIDPDFTGTRHIVSDGSQMVEATSLQPREFYSGDLVATTIQSGNKNDIQVPSSTGLYLVTEIDEKSQLLNRSFEEVLGSEWTITGASGLTSTTNAMAGEGLLALEISPTASWSVNQDFNCDSYTGNTVGFEGWVKSDQKANVCFTRGGSDIDCAEYDGSGVSKKIKVTGNAVSGSNCGLAISYATPTAEIYLDGFEFTTDPIKLVDINSPNSFGYKFLNSGSVSIPTGGDHFGHIIGLTRTGVGDIDINFGNTYTATPTGVGTQNFSVNQNAAFEEDWTDINRLTIRIFNSAGTSVDLDFDLIVHRMGTDIRNPTGNLITASDIVSTDAMTYKFKDTALDCNNDAVGTYNTFSLPASSEVPTICATAPTTLPNVTDGIAITSRNSYGNPITCAQGARYKICIGKGLKGRQFDGYETAGKVDPVFFDHVGNNSTGSEPGVGEFYEETTGELTIDFVLLNHNGSYARKFGRKLDGTYITVGFLHFSASKNPIVTGSSHSPKCTIEYFTAQNTSGGSCGGTGSFFTYPLSRIKGECRFLTFDDGNDQIVLQKGSYYINGIAQFYRVGGVTITLEDTTNSNTLATSLNALGGSGTTAEAQPVLGDPFSIGGSEILEIQYRVGALSAGTQCLGVQNNYSEEIYGKFTIEKVK